jgi:hypothetical protein
VASLADVVRKYFQHFVMTAANGWQVERQWLVNIYSKYYYDFQIYFEDLFVGNSLLKID